MWRNNALTRRLNINAPIILGPFGSRGSSEELVTIVSEAGGLGIFGANLLSSDEIIQLAIRLRTKTSMPFGLNLWIPTADQPQYEAPNFERARARLAPYFDELALKPPTRPDRFLPIAEEQIEAVLDARPSVFSFIYGVPAPDV